VSGVSLLQGSYTITYYHFHDELTPRSALKDSTITDFQRLKWTARYFGRMLAHNSGISAMLSPGILASIIESDMYEVTSVIKFFDL
jgi:hypothetical protein